VIIIESEPVIMEKFAELKADLYDRKLLLPDADILIAASCLSKCKKLITGNVKHFKRFGGLVVESWL